MKWFQHLSDSHTNPKIRQILRKYGVEGVGLWWITCELVAKDGEKNCIKAEKEWKITLQDVSRVEIKKMEEMLNFFAEINSIDKKALKMGKLFLPKLADYSDDYTKRSDRVRTVSEHTPNSVRQQYNTIHNNTKEESDLLINLKEWNKCQTSPLPNFKPENIVRKHGFEKVVKLFTEYGKINGGFSKFLGSLNS